MKNGLAFSSAFLTLLGFFVFFHARAQASQTVWLCRPGATNNPCTADIDTTLVGSHGPIVVERRRAVSNSRFDCFYLYPTLSMEQTENADLNVDDRMHGVARSDASQFSQVCSVWSPVYRQMTIATIAKSNNLSGIIRASRVSYKSALAAWRDYIEHYNHGRPFILLGASQGAANLLLLLQREIDPNPALRRQLVSAILVGTNVTVRAGSDKGGSFKHIRACRTTGETRCVIAYQSYIGVPPKDSAFGTPGSGVSLFIGQTAASGLRTLCTNPADLDSHRRVNIDSLFMVVPPQVTVATAWVEYRDLYSAQCRHTANKTWLDVRRRSVPGDVRPTLRSFLPPRWGLHEFDWGLYLGDLVRDVEAQEARFNNSSVRSTI
jgi:hypothetical protein